MIENLFMRLIVLYLKIVYFPFLLLKQKEKIVILSRQSNKPTLDIRYLTDELRKKNIEVVVLTKRLNKNIKSILLYALHMFVQMYHIASSKVIVLDGYCILTSILNKRKNHVIVQIWHSLGAIKQFGYQTVGKENGNNSDVAKIMKLYKKLDYVIAPGMITANHYSEAFDIPLERIKLYGLPRIDYLLNENVRKKKQQISNIYPQINEKPIILYAPTFRRNSDIDIHDFVKTARINEYNLVIKKHWLDKTDYSSISTNSLIIDENFNFLDWLIICDKIITDYSAAAFEASILKKDLYFYIKDKINYSRKVGLNIDVSNESISRYVYHDADMLWKNIDKKYDTSVVTSFSNKYIDVELNECTMKLANFLVAQMK